MQKWTDEHVEILIGNLLQFGVILATSVVLFGGILYLARHGETLPQYHVFGEEPLAYRTVSGTLLDALKFHGRGIIQLGLLLLIATPVARVAFSAIAFAIERDRLYVVVTLIVFGTLISSLIRG